MYIYQNQEGLEYLCSLYKDGHITGNHIQVLLYLISKIENGSNVYINNTKIADALKINLKNTNTYIKKLIEVGVLFHGTTLGINAPYVLYPTLGYKGKLDTITELLDKINNIIMKKGEV